MLYLDANVFCYAILYEGPKADGCRSVLQDMTAGRQPAVTASLTVDEVVWALQKERDRALALKEAARVLRLPNLEILEVGPGDLHHGLRLMDENEGLSPRDGIHAAVAIRHGVYTIVSEDEDFDEVSSLSRRPLRELPVDGEAA